jgi:hypothetical protein
VVSKVTMWESCGRLFRTRAEAETNNNRERLSQSLTNLLLKSSHDRENEIHEVVEIIMKQPDAVAALFADYDREQVRISGDAGK